VITTTQWARASVDVPSSLELATVVGSSPAPPTFRETLFSDEAETDFSLKQCDIGSQNFTHKIELQPIVET
jgi:hypothetical protein